MSDYLRYVIDEKIQEFTEEIQRHVVEIRGSKSFTDPSLRSSMPNPFIDPLGYQEWCSFNVPAGVSDAKGNIPMQFELRLDEPGTSE